MSEYAKWVMTAGMFSGGFPEIPKTRIVAVSYTNETKEEHEKETNRIKVHNRLLNLRKIRKARLKIAGEKYLSEQIEVKG